MGDGCSLTNARELTDVDFEELYKAGASEAGLMSAKADAATWLEAVAGPGEGPRSHLRAGRGDQSRRRAGRALPRRDQPAHRRARAGLLGRLLRRRRARGGGLRAAGRSCPARCWPRRTCPTWPRWCRSSTSSRSSGRRGTRSIATRGGGSSSSRSTSTSDSSRPCRATTTRSRCASSSAPAFIDWTTSIPAEVDFGITDQQLFFHWRLRERTRAGAGGGPEGAGGIFERLHREMEENGLDTYRAGPWNAGLEPFPTAGKPRSQYGGLGRRARPFGAVSRPDGEAVYRSFIRFFAIFGSGGPSGDLPHPPDDAGVRKLEAAHQLRGISRQHRPTARGRREPGSCAAR